jgi:hypothetical protein
MNRPLIGNRTSWADFEKCILEVFTLALAILRDKPSLPVLEDSVNGKDSLNRRLDICLRTAILEWENTNQKELLTSPKSNLGQQPNLDDEEKVDDYERAKPDFQWELKDSSGNSASLNLIFRNYQIECKRLGSNLGSRSLCKDYISNGVIRFTQNTHRYGQFTSSGLMIGYVQNTELQMILGQLNNIAKSSALPEILLSPEGWKEHVSRLDHQLDRPDIELTPFELRHLWVDLRHHYAQPDTFTPKKTPKREKKTKLKNVPKSIS